MSLLNETIFERHTATWRELSTQLAMRWRLIVIVWVVTLLSTYVGLQLMTERFESKATVLVKVGRENAEVPTTVQNSGLISAGVSRDVVNSEMEILTSGHLIEQTVDKFGPDVFAFKPAAPRGVFGLIRYSVKSTVRWFKKQGTELLYAANLKKRLTNREAAIQLLSDSLHVDVQKDSNVIAIRMELPDPGFCVNVTNTLLELYLAEHQRAWRTPQSKGFFLAQREENRQQLEDLDKVRDKIRARWSLSSVNEQRSALLREVSDLNSQIVSNKAEIDDLRRQSAVMTTRAEALPERQNVTEVQTQNSSIQSIKERLTSLELERAKLLSHYQPGREPVKKVEAEISDLRNLLASQPPTLLGSVSSEINPIRQTFAQGIEQYRVKIAGLEEKDRTLSHSADGLLRQLRALNAGEDQLESVERDLKVAQDNYLTYAKRMEEDRISEALDFSHVSNVAILSPASTPLEPVYPRRLLIMAVALGLGLVLGISLAFLLEYLDDTIRKPQDIADMEDVHVLGTFRANEYRGIA